MWISLGMGSLGNTWFLLLVYMIWWIPLWLAWCFSFLPLTHGSVILDCHVLCFLSNGIIGGFWNVYNNYGEKGWWMNWSVPGWKGKFVIVTPPPSPANLLPNCSSLCRQIEFCGPKRNTPCCLHSTHPPPHPPFCFNQTGENCVLLSSISSPSFLSTQPNTLLQILTSTECNWYVVRGNHP